MKVVVLILAAFLTACIFGPTAVLAQKKPALRSVDGRVLELRPGYSTKQKDVLIAEARELIWSRWSQQVVGRISVRTFGIDGPITTTTFFVKRNTHGDLGVQVVVEERGIWSRKKVVSVAEYVRVDRVEIVTDATSPEIPMTIPKASERNPISYAIRLVAADRDNDFLF